MTTAFHPELRFAARWLPGGIASPFLVRLTRLLPVPSVRLPEGVTVAEHVVDGGPVRVRVIATKGDGRPRPALVWIHGGGYIIGSAKQDDLLAARFALAADVVVCSVDYRLAPEHPFPTPVEDCFAAWEFVQREAPKLGIDPRAVVLGGASAGGGLAAALSLLLHDRARTEPVLQLLVYPMLDDRTVLRDVDGRMHRVWNQNSNRFGWRAYLGREPGAEDVVDHAAPARRLDLSGLPPAWIGVGTCDLFHDEDVEYARRLKEAGVPVEVDLVEGAFHGFDLVFPKRSVSRGFFDRQVAAITRAVRSRPDTRGEAGPDPSRVTTVGPPGFEPGTKRL